ncbi:MAG: MBOAT family protein [Rhizobiaceae bacterium]|nr:MBOAT family protein [Rhizobiaceae bacterium]
MFLLGVSYFFYGYWDWRFCFLLLFASLVAYAAGVALATTGDLRRRKLIVGVAVTLLLAVLGFFKYYNFFLDSLSRLLEVAGLERDMLFLEILLPVGISFFTFHAISYIVDVYRGDAVARRSVVDVLLYMSFFPPLVAGPIVRAAQFLPQLESRRRLTRRALAIGLVLCLVGLFKKMVVANYLATDLVDPVFFDPSAYGTPVLLFAAYGYAVQIYCDFSGYSDLAIGTAALLGYHLKPNFRQPYRSGSLQEFWRRWHISLSSWLRDYLYKPLGGSRHGELATYRNLFVTMFLGGLWHGAAWTFVIWGMLHGAGLAAERWFRDRFGTEGRRSAIGAIVAVVLTFHFVCAAWIFFRAENFGIAMDYFAGLAALAWDVSMITPFSLALIAIPLLFQFTPENLAERIAASIKAAPALALAVGTAVGVVLIELVAPAGTAPFIYFQF